MVVKFVLKLQLSYEEGRKRKAQRSIPPIKELSGTPKQMTTAYISLVTSICKTENVIVGYVYCHANEHYILFMRKKDAEEAIANLCQKQWSMLPLVWDSVS